MDLRQAPPFSHFSREQIVLLGKCGTRRRYPAGATLVPGCDGRLLAHILLRGRVRIHRETPYGPFQLSTLGAGIMIGEVALLSDDLASLDISAETEVDTLVLDTKRVLDEMDSDNSFHVAVYWALWKSLSAKLRDCNTKLTRFFSSGGPSQAPDPPEADPTSEYKIDIEDKRAVFREQRLSNMEINFLASLSKAKQLAPNEILFREGDPGEFMYLVQDGRIMISKNIPGAGEEALAFLERGEILGEMALIDDAPRSADAKADKDGAIVLSVRKEVLEKLLNIEKVSSARLLETLCFLIARRLRDSHEKIVGWYILSGGDSASM